MSVQLTKILKGVQGKLGMRKSNQRFQSISWLREKILKHEEDKKKKRLHLGGMNIYYRRPYELMHTYNELFVDEIYKFKASTPSPLIIDCGANIGLSVLYFKQLYPNASIIAFEPDKDNFMLLQENIAANKLTAIDCRESAVWIKNGTISFSAAGTQDSHIVDDNTSGTILIKAERLADIIRERKVDFLKIDIEGAEVEVLNDCEPFLHNVEMLFVEYHGKVEETEKLTRLLQICKRHFKVYIKLAADNLQEPFITKTTGHAFDVQLNIFCYR